VATPARTASGSHRTIALSQFGRRSIVLPMYQRRRTRLLRAIPAIWLLATVSTGHAQSLTGARARGSELTAEGWTGFTDVAFLGRALLALTLATLLGALLAYHPRRRHTVDSIESADAPKVFVLYAVIGAAIGIMVLKYGLVVGFVVFGIGGLTRFRTDLPSAPETGRLILITLVGLSCGLELPHLAVLTAGFGFAVLMALDARATYHIEVKGLDRKLVGPAADAYREALSREGCRIVGERKSFSKEQVTFVFHAPHALQRDGLVERLEAKVPESLRGLVDWGVD
jgi:hypothetical protein